METSSFYPSRDTGHGCHFRRISVFVLGVFASFGACQQALADPTISDVDYTLSGLSLRAEGLSAGAVQFQISPDSQFRAVVSTFAGAAGVPGSTDGPRSSAKFNYPSGVVQDSAGNFFIADVVNNKIRMVTPSGEVRTIAGTGSLDFTNGTGLIATFASPGAIAVGPLPNEDIYVADTFNHSIRKLRRPAAPGGAWIVSTLAGGGEPGFVNASGGAARFNQPGGIAVDLEGNLYVADSGNHRIRKVTPGGLVSTFAGEGTEGDEEGAAEIAKFAFPSGIAVGPLPNEDIYVADTFNHSIRMIDSTGTVSTMVGTDSSGYFNKPADLGFDPSGNLYVADSQNHRIQKVALNGVVTTLAGTGVEGPANGLGTAAQFKGPTGLTVDLDGNLIVGDTQNHLLRRILVQPITVDAIVDGTNASAVIDAVALGLDSNTDYFFQLVIGGVVQTPAAGSALSFNLTDPPAVETAIATGITTTAATLNAAVDPGGSDTTVAFDYSTDPNLNSPLTVGTHARSLDAKGLAVDTAGNVYIASRSTHEILKITPTGVVSNLAGTPGVSGSNDGTGTSAQFDNPSDLAIDTNGNLYVADEFNQLIRKVTTPGGVVSTIAGSGEAGFADNAIATNGQFHFPCGVAVEADGSKVYIADRANHRIRVISLGALDTLAGDGTAGFADGAGGEARFNQPVSVDVDADGNVVVADRDNHRVRIVNSGGIVSTAGGSGVGGFLDGVAETARFASPSGVAFDALGNILVADRDNHRLRLIANGEVSTVAGSGLAGSIDTPPVSTHLYPATYASFSSPLSVAVHPVTGTMFLSEEGGSLPAVRKIERTALFSITLANELNVTASHPLAETLLAGATYYFRASVTNSRNPSEPILGEILSFTTKRNQEITVFDGPDTGSPGLIHQQAAAVDFGNTASDMSVVRTFTIANTGEWNLGISAINVIGTADFVVTGGTGPIMPGDSTTFEVTFGPNNVRGIFEAGIEIDSDDPLLDPDQFTFPVTVAALDRPALTAVTISGVTPTGATLDTTVNPNGSNTMVWFDYAPDAEFDGFYVGKLAETVPSEPPVPAPSEPSGMAADSAGNIYVADSGAHQILKLTPTEDEVTSWTESVFAGTGVAGYTDGPGASAQFNQPYGLVFGADGALYVSDSGNHRIRAISPSGEVTTFSGLGDPGFTDGVGGASRFNVPKGLAIDDDGNLFVADSANHRIRKVAPDASVSTLAGNGTAGSGNGAGATAQFTSPCGLTITSAGVLYASETGTSMIRQIQPGGTVATVVGAFTGPAGLAVDNAGNVYVADSGNHRIYQITPAGVVSAFAGSGTAGTDDGFEDVAQFDTPVSIAMLGTDTVIVGESGASTLRRIDSTTVRVPAGAFASNGDPNATDLPADVTLAITGMTARPIYYIRAVASNGGGELESPTVELAPEITVEQPLDTTITDGSAYEFGPVADNQSHSRTFTIRNEGNAYLTLPVVPAIDLMPSVPAITFNGTHATDFTVTIPPAELVEPGGTTTFTVKVAAAPVSEGDRTAGMAIANNDRDENPFDLVLSTGVPVLPSTLDELLDFYFNTATTSPDIAGPEIDASGDGVSNLLKIALGLDPTVSTQDGLPVLGITDDSLTLTYNRAIAVTDLSFSAEWSTDMINWKTDDVTELVLSSTPTTWRVQASVPINGASRKFMRLRVTRN